MGQTRPRRLLAAVTAMPPTPDSNAASHGDRSGPISTKVQCDKIMPVWRGTRIITPRASAAVDNNRRTANIPIFHAATGRRHIYVALALVDKCPKGSDYE